MIAEKIVTRMMLLTTCVPTTVPARVKVICLARRNKQVRVMVWNGDGQEEYGTEEDADDSPYYIFGSIWDVPGGILGLSCC